MLDQQAQESARDGEDHRSGVTWEPPGPGSWTLDTVHLPNPGTAQMQLALEWFRRGFAEVAERYGWLTAGVDMHPVNGFLYTTILPLPGDQFPARLAASERAFAEKVWRDDVARWNDEIKPAALRAHRALIDVDPDALDDAGLAEHLRACERHHWAMWLQHHQMNGPAMIPPADFIVSAHEWTGLPPSQIAQALSGASPISAGACPESVAVAAAIAADPDASALLESDLDGAEVLERLASL
jgi:rifampicin phosphotransferase